MANGSKGEGIGTQRSNLETADKNQSDNRGIKGEIGRLIQLNLFYFNNSKFVTEIRESENRIGSAKKKV
jgi:hypothetical protein